MNIISLIGEIIEEKYLENYFVLYNQKLGIIGLFITGRININRVIDMLDYKFYGDVIVFNNSVLLTNTDMNNMLNEIEMLC